MNANGTAKEMKLLVEGLIDTVRKYQDTNPEIRYSLRFGYVTAPQPNLTSSDVLSQLDKLNRGLSQFPDDQKITAEVEMPMVNTTQDEFMAAVQKYLQDRQPKEQPKLQAVPDGNKN